jgi:polyisoprenoid-binding protein YceI
MTTGDKMIRTTLILLAVCFSALTSADWELAKSTSSLSFTSTKNETVTETHHFKELDGRVLDNGEVTFEINLFSVDTSIEIRDQRLKDLLFAIAPEAIFTAQVDLQELKTMEPGVSVTKRIDGKLQLHGFQEPLTINSKITGLDFGRIHVDGTGQIDVSTFGYEDGIEELRTIAGLDSISTIVDFQINLTFRIIEDS